MEEIWFIGSDCGEYVVYGQCGVSGMVWQEILGQMFSLFTSTNHVHTI